MELAAPIKRQKRYLIVGTSYKLAPAEGSGLRKISMSSCRGEWQFALLYAI
ncbi:hypothetical protein [Capnocytophaga granulosa]|uniref:hypothetical protein n=1 Tax=Capnocytophaga granulosa TaxID=45242 RepID=UPI0023EF9751|nr:hypothetical protein [Capnocytophaga granulosa]